MTYRDSYSTPESYYSKLTVMKFNGNRWEDVGTAGFSPGEISDTSLVFNGNTPYVPYVNGSINKAK